MDIVSINMELSNDILRLEKFIEDKKYDEGMMFFKEVYFQYSSVLGKGYIGTIELLYMYGQILLLQKEYKQCIEVMKDLYDLVEDNLNDRHPYIQEGLDILSKCYREMHEYDNALQCDQQNYVMNRQLLGDNHEKTLQSQYAIYQDLMGLDEFDRAFEYLLHLYEQTNQVLDSKHILRLKIIKSMGDMYSDCLEHEEAVKYRQAALEMTQQIYGQKSQETLHALIAFIHDYQECGYASHVSELLITSYELSIEVYGQNHFYTLQVLEELADCYESEHEFLKALECYQLCYKIAIVNHCEIKKQCYYLDNIGLTYSFLHQHEKALEYFLKSYELIKKDSKATIDDYLYDLKMIIEEYRCLKDYKNLITVCNEYYLYCHMVFGSQNPITLEALYDLGYCHYLIEDYHQAYLLFEQCYKTASTLSDKDFDLLKILYMLALTCQHLDIQKSSQLFEKYLMLAQESNASFDEIHRIKAEIESLKNKH